MIRLAALGAALLALTFGALALHVPGADTVGSPSLKNVFVAVLALSVAVYFGAVRESLRPAPPARAVWLVLLVAVALRVPVLLAPPFLSSDVYRYVWDGRVQTAGINPYRFVPGDPALARLRDDAVYPRINRADYAPTIYPPTAQIVYAAVGQIAQSVTLMKLAMVAFEALAVLCLLRLLTLAGLPAYRVLIYAWNPLAVWAFAGNGHVDAIAIGLLALTLLLRARLRDGWAGAVFGAAVLVKFLPVVVTPTLWRARAGWRLTSVCLLTIAALYACYADVGWRVLGFLPSYRVEEGLDSGSGIWFLAGLETIWSLPSSATLVYFAVAAAGLGVFGLSLMTPDRTRVTDPVALCGGAALLMAGATAAISPHYPWYFAWLALPCVLAPYRAVLFLSAAPVLLYLDPFHERFIWPSLVYVPAVLLAIVDLRRKRGTSAAIASRVIPGSA